MAKKKQNFEQENVDEMVEQLKRSYESGASEENDGVDPSADDEAFAKMLMDMFGKHADGREATPAKKSNELYSAEDFMPDDEELEPDIEEDIEEDLNEDLDEETEDEPEQQIDVAAEIRLQAQAQIEAQVQSELSLAHKADPKQIPADELPWFEDDVDEIDEEDLREIAEYEALVAQDELEQAMEEDEDDFIDEDELEEDELEEDEDGLEDEIEEDLIEDEPAQDLSEEQSAPEYQEDEEEYQQDEDFEEDEEYDEELDEEYDEEYDEELDEESFEKMAEYPYEPEQSSDQDWEKDFVPMDLSSDYDEPYPVRNDDDFSWDEDDFPEDEDELFEDEDDLIEDEEIDTEIDEEYQGDQAQDAPAQDNYVEDLLDSLEDWHRSVQTVKEQMRAEHSADVPQKSMPVVPETPEPAKQKPSAPETAPTPVPAQDELTSIAPDYPDEDPMQGRLVKTAVASGAPDNPVELDEKDIHMMTALGYGREVKGRVGSERVRHAVNAQKKKSMRKGTENPTCFAYRGKEYVDAADEAEIKQAYHREKPMVIIRLAACITALFLLIALDNAFLLHALDGVRVPDIVSSPLYPLLAACLLCLVAACSARRLWHGLRSIFFAKQSLYSVAAVLMILSVLYDLLLIVAARGQYMMFNSLAVLALLLCVIRDVLRLYTEEQTFALVRSGKPRYGIEKATDAVGAGSKLPVQDGEHVHHPHPGAYRVRRVEHFGGYFGRMGDAGEHTALVSVVFGVLIVAGIAAACVTYIVSGQLLSAMGAFMVCVNGGMPLSMLVFTAIPSFLAGRTLAKSGCGMIGDGCREEYRDVKELMFDASLMFSAQSAAKITVRGDSEIGTYIEKSRLLLGALGSTLAGIAGEPREDDPPVKIEIMSVADNGLTLYMDGVTCVMMGDYDYLSARGVRLPGRELEKNYKRRKDSAVIYLAFDGTFRVGYSVDHVLRKEFLMRARQLSREGLTPVIVSYDPCINTSTVQARADGYGIFVERQCEYEDPHQGAVLDCGIVATQAPEDVLLPLLACRKLRRIRIIGLVLRYAYLALSVGLIILLCCLGAVQFAWPLLLVLYQALWLVLIPVVCTNLLGDLRKKK